MSRYLDVDCTQSPEFQILVEEAISINSSQKRLEELAALSINMARLVVSNPSTSPGLLQKLAKRPDFVIHQNIVANPKRPFIK